MILQKKKKKGNGEKISSNFITLGEKRVKSVSQTNF